MIELQDIKKNYGEILALQGISASIERGEIVGLLAATGAYDAIRAADLRMCCLQRETLAAASPLADAAFALQALGTTPILLGGSDTARARFAEPALAGKHVAAFAMTEPDVASSDATNIALSIVAEGDDYVINGRKWFITGAMNSACKILIVMGKTDPDAQKHQQQYMNMVPLDSPGGRWGRPVTAFG